MTLLAAAGAGRPPRPHARVQNSSIDGDVSSSPSLQPPREKTTVVFCFCSGSRRRHMPRTGAAWCSPPAVVSGGEPCRAHTAGGGGGTQLGDVAYAYLSASLLLLRYAIALSSFVVFRLNNKRTTSARVFSVICWWMMNDDMPPMVHICKYLSMWCWRCIHV